MLGHRRQQDRHADDPAWPLAADARAGSTEELETVADYAFLLDRHVAREDVELALAEGWRLGVPAVKVLIARGWISSCDYAAGLAQHLAPAAHPVDGDPTGQARQSWPIDATAASPRAIAAEVEWVRGAGAVPLILDREAVALGEPATYRRRRAHRAAWRLRQSWPDLSASRHVSRWQLIAAVSVPGAIAGGLAVLPVATLAVTAAITAIPFLFIVTLRMLALLVVLAGPRRERADLRDPLAHDDSVLPSYAILVPLFREADVLPGLVAAIADLDYPPEKLDAVLVLEHSDAATRAAAAALELPAFMRVVVVPDGEPRTKPKALNYALQLIAAELVVIYDAEDQPEAEQLRMAAAAFRRGGPELACVQARLTIYNWRRSWLARQFALEYAALFDGLLPALCRLGLPIPLGGTSNHFVRAELVRIGGWDAHNVTEDADIGIRLARAGLKVDVIASDTEEEAPENLGVWLRQRTRWHKGYIQTWAVHMRRPGRLMAEAGVLGFIGINALIGGHVLSALLHPFCVVLVAVAAVQGALFGLPENVWEGMLLAVAVFNLGAGYGSALVLAAVAAVRRGLGALMWQVALMPVYWMLVSVAVWRAFWQVARDPYGWEKTPHAPRPSGVQRRRC